MEKSAAPVEVRMLTVDCILPRGSITELQRFFHYLLPGKEQVIHLRDSKNGNGNADFNDFALIFKEL